MTFGINAHLRLAGYYRVQVLGQDKKVIVDTGWFRNLITNTGLDQFGLAQYVNFNIPGTSQVPNRCAVGTSSTAPAVTDTVLGAQIGAAPGPGINSNGASTVTYVAGPPAYWSSVSTFTFAVGAVVGNIAEIGTGGTTSLSAVPVQLFSHALIVDGTGTPTTISVTASDQLVVTFELRHYLDLTDTAYSVTISGTSYSGVIRRCAITNTSLTNPSRQVDDILQTINGTVYNGSIGSVTSTGPSGTSADLGSSASSSYTAGTYYKSYTFSANTSQANVSGGISAILIQCTWGEWQLSVSPPIAKDATKTMTLSFNISWSRYP